LAAVSEKRSSDDGRTRDRSAARRDVDAGVRDRMADTTPENERVARRHAAQDRMAAMRDRQAAARDRERTDEPQDDDDWSAQASDQRA
jgi:hypothetical protein